MADTDLPNGFGALNRPPRPIASPFGMLADRCLGRRQILTRAAAWLQRAARAAAARADQPDGELTNKLQSRAAQTADAVSRARSSHRAYEFRP